MFCSLCATGDLPWTSEVLFLEGGTWGQYRLRNLGLRQGHCPELLPALFLFSSMCHLHPAAHLLFSTLGPVCIPCPWGPLRPRCTFKTSWWDSRIPGKKGEKPLSTTFSGEQKGHFGRDAYPQLGSDWGHRAPPTPGENISPPVAAYAHHDHIFFLSFMLEWMLTCSDLCRAQRLLLKKNPERQRTPLHPG